MKNSKIYFQNRKEVIKMKKKLLMLLVILSTMSTLEGKTNNKKDCYIPKGELGCVTDMSTPEGMKKATEMGTKKREVYKAAKVYFDKGRFGNEQVGFIAYPKGNWALFYDPDASLSAFQIANGTDIYTLDAIRIATKQGKTDSQIATEIINNLYIGYKGAGHPESGLVRKSVVINGYKGEQLTVKNISGLSLISNVIVTGNKIYFISVEGVPSHVGEMMKWVTNSWNPYK